MKTIPRTVFGEEHRIFREAVRRFVEAEIVPAHSGWETEGFVPSSAWHKAGQAGLLGCCVPEAYGGAGGDFLHSAVVIEELARVGSSGPCFPLHSDVVAPYLIHFGSEQLKQRWLPGMVDGTAPGAIAMTEPDGGSDLRSLRTRSVRVGDDFVLNGQKVYISNAVNAAFVIVACRTGGGPEAGISLILVETDRPGFQRGRRFDKIGCKAQDLSELFFADCTVPATNLVGELDGGFRQMLALLPQERLVQAVRAVAACEAMLDWTVAHVRSRKLFGRRLADLQQTRFQLATLHAEVTCQRVFVDRCLELHCEGAFGDEMAAMAKLLACELQGRVADACLQMFGAAGFMTETPIARAYVDARQARIAGGTVEIMKHIIGRALLAGQ